MVNEISFEIEGFGPINYASIEVNQINILGGINSSGKTTSSKLLYSFLTSISQEGNQLADKSINKRLMRILFMLESVFQENNEVSLKLEQIFNFINRSDYEKILNILTEILESNDFENKQTFEKDLKQLKKIINLNKTEAKYGYILDEVLLSEFRINKYPQDFKVSFKGNFNGNKFDYNLNSNNNKLRGMLKLGKLDSLIFDEIIYIDSSSILDSFNDPFSDISFFKPTVTTPFHIQNLSKKLTSKQEIDVYGKEFFKEIEPIKQNLERIIEGKIEFDHEKNEFIYKTRNNEFPMNNTASGIKQMGILYVLLDKAIINNKSFVFIDEPEVNLHPEWQVELAKLIISLSKHSDITFYINSHSSFFIEAIEIFSEYYEMKDKTNFYLTEKKENKRYDIKKVDFDEIYKLYENLGNPFKTLNEYRIKNRLKE